MQAPISLVLGIFVVKQLLVLLRIEWVNIAWIH